MNKTWLSVIIAAFFEVCWVIGLKHADSVLEWEEQSWGCLSMVNLEIYQELFLLTLFLALLLV